MRLKSCTVFFFIEYMNINDCNFRNRFEWDYLGWKLFNRTGTYDQKDWNQTLLTKINQTSANIIKGTHVGGANTIQLNSSLKPLINDLEYYFDENRTICDRYKVIFDEGITHEVIYVYNDKVFKEPLLYPILTKDHVNGISEISFKFSSEFPLDIIEEYKKTYFGCIKIQNYLWNKT